MKRYIIQSSSPFGDQEGASPLTEYTVLLETESGYSEEQKYACEESDHESVLAQALDVFCNARALIEEDPLAFLR